MTEISKCSLCLTNFNRDKFIETGRIKYGKPCGHPDGENQGETAESTLLNAQVSVIYLVHNILDIPLEKCSQYLKKYGNPADWVTLCQGCATTLENARYLYLQLLPLQKTLDDLKELIMSQMRVEDPNAMDFDERDKSWITAPYEIRQYVAYARHRDRDELIVEANGYLTISKNPLTSDMPQVDEKLRTSLEIDDDESGSESMFFIEEPDLKVNNSPPPKSVDEDFEYEFFETVNEEEEVADKTSDQEECNDSNHDNKTRSQLRDIKNLLDNEKSKSEEQNKNLNAISFVNDKDSTTALESDEEVVIVRKGLPRTTSGKSNSQNAENLNSSESAEITFNSSVSKSSTDIKKTSAATKMPPKLDKTVKKLKTSSSAKKADTCTSVPRIVTFNKSKGSTLDCRDDTDDSEENSEDENEKDDKVDKDYGVPAGARKTSGESNRKNTLRSSKASLPNTVRRQQKVNKLQTSTEPKRKGTEEETKAKQVTKLKKRVDRYSCHLCPQILDTLHQVRKHLCLKHSIPYDKVMDMKMKVDINGCIHLVTASGGSKDKEEVKARQSRLFLKNFNCRICGLRFLHKNGLQKHFDEYHNTKVPLKSCSICRRHFHTDKAFEAHVNEKPVQFGDSCSVSPTQLKRPFGCGHCQMSFASKKCVAFHVETHENSGNGFFKHFRCYICGVRRIDFSSFVEHVTRHGKKVTIPKSPQLYINKTGPGRSWSGMNFNQAKNLIERIKASEAINPIPQYARSKSGSKVTFNKDKGVTETIQQKSVSVAKNDVAQTSSLFKKANFLPSVSIKRISQSARPVVNTYKNSNDSTCSITPIAATASPGVAWPGVPCNKFMAVDQNVQKTIELGPVVSRVTVKPKVYTNFNLCPNCDARIKSFTPDSEEFKEHLRFCQKKYYKSE